ncbi:MAG: HAD family phosphatase [Pseudomonadota bacterium]
MFLKAVLFDHDGTLVDSEGAHWRIWQQVLQPYGVDLDEDTYKAHHAGMPTVANAQDLVARFALAVPPATLVQQKNDATRQYLDRNAFPLMPHASEAVDAIRAKGAKLAVVTGAGPDGVQATLRAYELADSFATIVTGEDVKRSKPAPDCYLLALERLGLKAEECIALEDTAHGVRAAAAAGLACCLVKNAFSETHDSSQAAATFGNLKDAMEWVFRNYRFAA